MFKLILKQLDTDLFSPLRALKASRETCQQPEGMSKESRTWDIILYPFLRFTEDNTP